MDDKILIIKEDLIRLKDAIKQLENDIEMLF